MGRTAVVIIAGLSFLAGLGTTRVMGKNTNTVQPAAQAGALESRISGLEEKIDSLVATQLRSSDNNRQVYGAVARLCTIFEGILQINTGTPPVPAEAQPGREGE